MFESGIYEFIKNTLLIKIKVLYEHLYTYSIDYGRIKLLLFDVATYCT